MKSLNRAILVALGLSLPFGAMASEEDEVTIRVMQMNEHSYEHVVRNIELPEAASENAETAPDDANKYRDRNRERNREHLEGDTDQEKTRLREESREHESEMESEHEHEHERDQDREESHDRDFEDHDGPQGEGIPGDREDPEGPGGPGSGQGPGS